MKVNNYLLINDKSYPRKEKNTMKNQPEKKMKKIYWVVCLIVVLGVTAVRVVFHFAGVELSDTLSRVFGGAEVVAVAAMAYTYMRWRTQNR